MALLSSGQRQAAAAATRTSVHGARAALRPAGRAPRRAVPQARPRAPPPAASSSLASFEEADGAADGYDGGGRIGWPSSWLEAVIVGKLGQHLQSQGLDFYTQDDLARLVPALAPRLAAAAAQLRAAPGGLGGAPGYAREPFHVWHGHDAWAPAANSEAVMSMFAYMALSPADQASLAAASPAPMRGSRPLVTRRVVDALLARLGMTADQVRRGVELGCGSGRLCRLAAGLLPNAEIIGVDASPYMVAAANAEEMMWSPEEAVDPRRVRFIAALAEDTGLEAGSCDFVMVPFVAHELPHAARLAFLSEARRLLRPGGAVAFIDHRQDGLEHTVFHKLKDSAPLLGDAFHWLVNIGAPEPFLREYHEHRMQDSFLQAGFEGGGPEGFVAVTRWQKAMIATKPLA